jgi:hypothetical protein
LKDFIASIPNLSGQGIWIVGEAATKGHIDSGRLEIFIQNGNDKATIVNAVKKAIPELYGKIVFYIGTPGKRPNVEVTPAAKAPVAATGGNGNGAG